MGTDISHGLYWLMYQQQDVNQQQKSFNQLLKFLGGARGLSEQQQNLFKQGSLAQTLASGDWSGMTLLEIADAVSVSEQSVRHTICYIKKSKGVDIDYKRMTHHKKLVDTPKKIIATAHERHTALELEARNRKISYGQLANQLNFLDEDRIVRAYIDRKKSMEKKKLQQCKGCSYWVRSSCSFSITKRLRRKDSDGLCLERTTEKRGKMR